MTQTQLGDIVRIDGRLAECIAISPEHPIFRIVGAKPCPTCGHVERAEIVEGCLNWQSQVEPVSTSSAAPDRLGMQ